MVANKTDAAKLRCVALMVHCPLALCAKNLALHTLQGILGSLHLPSSLLQLTLKLRPHLLQSCPLAFDFIPLSCQLLLLLAPLLHLGLQLYLQAGFRLHTLGQLLFCLASRCLLCLKQQVSSLKADHASAWSVSAMSQHQMAFGYSLTHTQQSKETTDIC